MGNCNLCCAITCQKYFGEPLSVDSIEACESEGIQQEASAPMGAAYLCLYQSLDDRE